MNKYQEALVFLNTRCNVSNRKNYFKREDSVKTLQELIDNYSNFNEDKSCEIYCDTKALLKERIAFLIERNFELEKNQEKYSWHYLRKDPNDLPKEDGKYLVCTETLVQFEYKFKFFKNYYVRKYYSDVNKFEGITTNADVIAWKRIEEFEDEN